MPKPLLALVAIIVVVGVFASNASAQEVECEQVPYNERIIVVCTSTGSNDKEMPGPAGDLSEPAPPRTQAGESDLIGGSPGPESDEPREQDSDDNEAGEGVDTVVGGADRDLNEDERPDRGDRGSRRGGADVGSGDGEADEGGDVSGSVDLGSDMADDSDSDDSDSDDSDSDDSDSDDGAGQGSLLLATEPEPDNLLIIVGVGALTAAGAVLFIAARPKKRDS
ncbi:MAG: hypothetical protein ACKVIQ_07660 [Acidimicrobiales bacterium]